MGEKGFSLLSDSEIADDGICASCECHFEGVTILLDLRGALKIFDFLNDE